MEETEAKQKQNLMPKQDSITFGTPTKGSVKIYFDLASISDAQAQELARRANGLYKYVQELGV